MKTMRKCRRFGRHFSRLLTALFLVGGAITVSMSVSVASAQHEAPAAIRTVSSIQQLLSFYDEMVEQYMPIATPAPHEPMWVSGNPSMLVMDLDASGWPAVFIAGLQVQSAYGVATYPVTVEQDEQYRYIYNASDEPLAVVPLAKGYDRHAFLRQRYPQLFATRFRSESTDWLFGVYDAQRIVLRVTLITAEGYAEWRSAVEVDLEAQQFAKAAAPAMPMGSQEFTLTDHRFDGGDLVLGWNSDEGTEYHVVERTFDLIGAHWTPVHWAQGTTNWAYTASSNEVEYAIYRVREFDQAYADSDATGSGLTALQAYLLGTDPDKRDTSGDGVPDGAVALAGGDPLHNSLDDVTDTLSYEYDEFDRLIGVFSTSHALTLSHDDAGNVSALTVQEGGQP